MEKMTFKQALQVMEKEYNESSQMQEIVDRLRNKIVVLFGAAWIGDFVYHKLSVHGVEVKCFCDNFAEGVTPQGHGPIIRPNELKRQYPEATIIITSDKAREIIYEQLLSLGFDKTQIIKDVGSLAALYDFQELSIHLPEYERMYYFFENDTLSQDIILARIKCYLLGTSMENVKSSSPQYFEKNLIQLSDQEVFIDGGAFVGDTIEEFIHQAQGKYKYIYGFEPDCYSRNKAMMALQNYQRITVSDKGLYSRDGLVRFATTGGSSMASGGTIVDVEGDNVSDITVTKLDMFFQDEKLEDYPTFIKMDLEGTEKEAILGAAQVIRQAKPKLAICVYHKPEDIYELTDLIYQLNSDYRFFLRHYANYMWETVLYAI